MADFEIDMKLTFRTSVMVQAETAAGAIEKAKRAAFYDNGMDRAEMSDWEVTSGPREVDED